MAKVKVEFSSRFKSMYSLVLQKNLHSRSEIDKRISWFAKNSLDTRLRNHPLKKRMKGKWAFSITDDIRIVYIWKSKNTVRFLAIGPHIEVYKK